MSLENFQSLSKAEQEVILNSPALEPPPGVIPNFINPANRNGLATFIGAICLILTTTAILIRAYSRMFCVRRIEIEDVLAFAVFGIFVGSVSCSYWTLSKIGLFVHQWDIQVKDILLFFYIFHIGANLCAVTLMIIRTSILLEWQRLFVAPGTRNYFFWICRLVLWSHILFQASWIVVENVSCTPYRKIWDVTVSEGSCININFLYIPGAIVNLLSDMIILVLPQRVIWGLQTSSKNKIGISLIFAVGILACVSAAFRIVESLKFVRSNDNLYTASSMYLWILAEQTSLFIVFCAPAAPKAFMTSGPRWRKLMALLMPRAKPTVKFAPNEPRPGLDNKLPRRCMFTKPGAHGISLTQVRSSRNSISESIEQLHRGDLETGILRTTQVIVEIAPKNDGHDGGLNDICR
ncbi:hypothetical protein F4818DRAFT_437924 [Hypoxylon cercidicola]|nr:hypothetical protein F4818DRAFT_437924 [Hypoxylon cercidicola]